MDRGNSGILEGMRKAAIATAGGGLAMAVDPAYTPRRSRLPGRIRFQVSSDVTFMVISKKLLDDLDERRAAALASGNSRAKGLMTARERLLGLYAQDTFLEFGLTCMKPTVAAPKGGWS